MVSYVAFIYVIIFILVQVSLLNYASGEVITHYENETHHRSLWDSDFHTVPTNRSKRSPSSLLPSQLKLRLKLGTELAIDVVWRKTKQYLANEYLRVSMSLADSAMNQNVMSDVGEFVMYRDLARCSAVVYFAKWNSFYGVIGTDYYIRGLPYNFDDMGNYRSGTIGEPYVQKTPLIPVHTSNTPFFPVPYYLAQRDVIHSVDDRPDQSNRSPSDAEQGPSNKRQRIERNIDEDEELDLTNSAHNVSHVRKRRKPERHYGKDYYSETLIFVTKDLVDHFRIIFGDECIAWIIRHNIIYFNAVDMMMAKLPRFYESHMHINIARIVIQDGTYPADSTNDNGLQFTDTVTKYRQFLHGNQNRYTTDSFDHVFIYTSRQIWDQSTVVDASTQLGADMYLARMYNQFYRAVPVTILQFKSSYLDYPVALHEIAQIFGISVDFHAIGNRAEGQCYSPMQKGGAKCIRCLRWSENHVAQFKKFTAKNRNRCFLENHPRSLLPPGPRNFLPSRTQCKCFGYDFYAKHGDTCPSRYVPRDSCGERLRCGKIDGGPPIFTLTVPPLDGTTCGDRKVCWEGECVNSANACQV